MKELKKIRKREDVPSSDTWATEDIFPSDMAWEQALESVRSRLGEYDRFKGRLGESAGMLYGCLRFDEHIGEMVDKIFSYAHLNSDVDTGNSEYQRMFGKAMGLWTEASAASAFISSEILSIPRERLEKFRKSEDGDRSFDRTLDLFIRDREHIRSREVEELLADVGEVTSGPFQIFKMFNNADIKFPMIKDETGQMAEMTNGRYVSFLESKDRTVRKEAFQAMYKTFGQYRNTLAANFQVNTKQAWFSAKTRKYSSTRACYLADAFVPEEVYDTLIDTVREFLPLMYRYVALRKRILGVEELHMYDLYVPLVSNGGKRFSWEAAKFIVLEAVKPMGTEYLDALKEGLESRWIDFAENEGKRSGAYSGGPYGVHPYVLMSYQERLDDVFTLIHEMGHALHSYFSNKNQTYTNSQYKIFVAEVASTCNENLLNHYLLSQAAGKTERAYILNHFLDGFKGVVFRQTMFAEFERVVHQMTQDGEVLTADVLCDIYQKLNRDYYGDGIVVDDGIAMEWARIPHFYTPFYVYQYATGFSAAVALSEKILKKEPGAVDSYMEFLKGGCSKDVIDLLADAGVDMRKPEPVREAMKAFEKALVELEELLS